MNLSIICAGPLWDREITWNTTDPDFTRCFHDVALPGVPLLYLLLLLPLELFFLWTSVPSPLPLSARFMVRTLGILLLLVTSAIQLLLTVTATQVETEEIIQPSAEVISFLIALILNVANMRRGVNSSGIVFGFWTLTFLCQSTTFFSVIRFETEELRQCLTYVKFGLSSMVFFLHFFADQPRTDYEDLDVVSPSPHLTSSFPNKLLFLWMTPYLYKGWRDPLTREDLWDLAASVKSLNVHRIWTKTWRKLSYHPSGQQSVGVLWMLTRTYGLSFLLTTLLQLAAVLLTQITPQFLKVMINNDDDDDDDDDDDVLKALIRFMNNDETAWKGYLYMAGLVGTDTLVSVLGCQYSLLVLIMSQKVR